MKKLILGLVLALLPQIALAEYILKGPHTTVETDGTQTDGSVNLITKNAGPINFYTDNVLRSSISSTGTTSYVGGLQCGGNLTFTTDASGILTDTVDGADNTYLFLNGGGADGSTRGGSIQLYGNEAAGTPGSAYLDSGAVAGSQLNLDGRGDGSPPIRLRTVATVGGALATRWGVENDGDLAQDATNGGNITMAKAGTSLIAGGAATVSGITGAPVEIQAAGSSVNALKVVGYSATAADGPYLTVGRTKGAAAATNTIVASGDMLGAITFTGANGTSYSNAAEIRVTSDGTPGASNDMPGAIAFRTTPDGSGTLTTALTINNAQAATFTGAVTSSATGALGWAVVDGADNTACTTQCTSAAVFGFNLAAGATAPVIVGPSDATADICLCAGAS